MTKVRGDGLDVEGLPPPASMAEAEAALRQLASSAADVASVAAAHAAARPLAHSVEAASSAAMMAAAEAAARPRTAEAEAAARATSAEAAGAALREHLLPIAKTFVAVNGLLTEKSRELAPVVEGMARLAERYEAPVQNFIEALNGARSPAAAAITRIATPSPAMRIQQELERNARLVREAGGRSVVRDLIQQASARRDMIDPRTARELRSQHAMLQSMGLAPRSGSAQSYAPAPSRPVASPAPAALTAPAPVVEAPAESKSERAKRLRRENKERLAKDARKEAVDDPAGFLKRIKRMIASRGEPSAVAGDLGLDGIAELNALIARAKPPKPPRKHRKAR